MCAQCDAAVTLYGHGQLSEAIRETLHPPTKEQLEARERAVADLVDYLNACDEGER